MVDGTVLVWIMYGDVYISSVMERKVEVNARYRPATPVPKKACAFYTDEIFDSHD